MLARTSFWIGILARLGLVLLPLGILSRVCRECQGGARADLTLPLAVAGLLFGVLRIVAFRFREREGEEGGWLKESDLAVSTLASMLGVWLLAATLAKPVPCPLCTAFWVCHYLTVALDATASLRTVRVLLPALVASSLCMVVARVDRAAWTNLMAFLENHDLAPGGARLVRPGENIDPGIILKPTTHLIVWTTCVPCQRTAAGPPLRAFLNRYPDARTWVARGAEKSLPSAIPDDWNIVPYFFFDALGMTETSPPAYATLTGHRIDSVGWLKDFR